MDASTQSTALCVSDLSISLEGVSVLDRIDLTLKSGEILVLQGSSGSGKTTLLHAIAGFIPYQQGTIQVGSDLLAELSESQKAEMRRSRLGLMTQDFHLLRKLSAERNAALAPLLAGAAPQDALRAARELLTQLGLEAHHRALASRLSRGQRQRVALARALAHPRPILLLDEPTSSLDAESRTKVLELIRDQAQNGSAVLIATHDEGVLPSADRLLRIRGGRIQEAP